MNRSFKMWTGMIGGCAAIAAAAVVYAADPAATSPPVRSNSVTPASTVVTTSPMTHTWRASQLEKMNVRNAKGEKIGAIEDLVVTADGRVAYAALGFGGFLGMGEKLFAIPWKDLQIHHADAKSNENHIVLNVTKEELKDAPGFDKANWPNFADPNFTRTIDKYYDSHRSADHNKVGQR